MTETGSKAQAECWTCRKGCEKWDCAPIAPGPKVAYHYHPARLNGPVTIESHRNYGHDVREVSRCGPGMVNWPKPACETIKADVQKGA